MLRPPVPFLLVLCLTVAALLPQVTRAASAQRFGKALLLEHRLPQDKVDRLNKFKASAPVKGESAVVNAMLADTEDWVAPPLAVRTAESPHTIVLLVKGTARAAGDAATLWQAGWRLEGGQNDGEGRVSPLAGLAKTGAKEGEAVELVAAAIPTTFREDRKVSPLVGMVNARNLHITEVRMQIWTGQRETGFAETLLSFRWALIGVVLVALWWFGFRRRS